VVFYVGGKGKIRYNYTLASIVNNNTGKWGVPLGTPTLSLLGAYVDQDVYASFLYIGLRALLRM